MQASSRANVSFHSCSRAHELIASCPSLLQKKRLDWWLVEQEHGRPDQPPARQNRNATPRRARNKSVFAPRARPVTTHLVREGKGGEHMVMLPPTPPSPPHTRYDGEESTARTMECKQKRGPCRGLSGAGQWRARGRRALAKTTVQFWGDRKRGTDEQHSSRGRAQPTIPAASATPRSQAWCHRPEDGPRGSLDGRQRLLSTVAQLSLSKKVWWWHGDEGGQICREL